MSALRVLVPLALLALAAWTPAAAATCVGGTIVCAGEETIDERGCSEGSWYSSTCESETGTATAVDVGAGVLRAERRATQSESNTTYSNPCYGTDGGYDTRRRTFDGVIVSTRSPVAAQAVSVGSFHDEQEYYTNLECLFLPDEGSSASSGTGVIVTGGLVTAWAWYGSDESDTVTRERGSTTETHSCERGLFVGLVAPLVPPQPRRTSYACGSQVEGLLP